MALPKIFHAIFPITVPSTKQSLNFRRFLVSEEKILLMAKQSGERADKLLAIKQVINNCAVDPLNVDELTTFDFDYIFLRLRANSVDNIVEIIYTDPEDDQPYGVTIDLNQIQIIIPDKNEKIITVNEDIKVELQYPTIGSLLKAVQDLQINEDKLKVIDLNELMIEQCIKTIYDKETVYDDYTCTELSEWIQQLPLEVNNKISQFILNIPDLKYDVTYTTKAGTVREVELRGIEDFFTL